MEIKLEWLKLKERDRVLLAYAGAIKWLVQYESDLYNKSRNAAIQGLKNDLSNKGTHEHNFKPAPFGPPKDISNRTLIGTVCKKKPESAFKLESNSDLSIPTLSIFLDIPRPICPTPITDTL